MGEKKRGLKKLFSKPKKDCCSVEFEEVKSNEEPKGCDTVEKEEKSEVK
ncbi:hypothetical protein [Anaerobacillus sp. 1_MG-2023]|nr:hypothetical protein [Anaerobacillus sp. 1_MG-2023]MDO6654435.1 hypothetical protein [Anaerobacillus sp. 1_MG-2023]